MQYAWDKEFSDETTIKTAASCSARIAGKIIDKNLRAGITKLLEANDYAGLVGFELDYSGGYSATDLIYARQALGFFQKLECLPLGLDKRAVAEAAFTRSEVLCRETNLLFTRYLRGDGLCLLPGVDAVLHSAQRKIARVLGRLPALSELDLTFGPGATTTVIRTKSCSRVKLSSRLTCSTNMATALSVLSTALPMYWELHASEDGDVQRAACDVHHGQLAFVPKNAKTYRSIMVEPTLNTMFQGGYGKWIGKRLLGVGQDITDQSRNQRLAREGSLTGDLATLDLSSASDTISRELVAHLLPYDWYSALDTCRTSTYVVDSDNKSDSSKGIRLEKFSSMGNGFTFPLQTLIFWALASSCAPEGATVSVYGDDIIVPTVAVPLLSRVFDACGFILNKEKSYWSGPFRESCGADYYLGVNIRPFYLKNRLSFERLFSLHNHHVRNFEHEEAAFVLGLIPEDLRLWGPDGYGDGHLIGDWRPRYHKRENGWGGYLFDTYKKLGRSHTRVLPGDRVLPAYTIYVKGDCRETKPLSIGRKDGVLRDSLPGVEGYKRITIYTLTPPK